MPTEIDYLPRRHHRIAERHGLQVSLSRRVLAAGKDRSAGKGSPKLTVEQIRFPSTLQKRTKPARIGNDPQ